MIGHIDQPPWLYGQNPVRHCARHRLTLFDGFGPQHWVDDELVHAMGWEFDEEHQSPDTEDWCPSCASERHDCTDAQMAVSG